MTPPPKDPTEKDAPQEQSTRSERRPGAGGAVKRCASVAARVGLGFWRGFWRGAGAAPTQFVLTFLGWIAFALIVVVTIVEHHPGLERMVARSLQRRLEGPLTDSISIDDIDVLWFRREVALRGVHMGPTGDEVIAELVRLRVGWSLDRGLGLDRVTIDGGGITVSSALSSGLGVVQGPGSSAQASGSTLDLLAQSPEVVVRDFAIGIQLPSAEVISIGAVDICMRHTEDEVATIWGRMLPTLVGPGEDSGVIWLNGTLGHDRIARVDGVARALRVAADPVPAGTPLASLAEFDPTARIDLVAKAEFEIGRSILPSVVATMRISNGSMQLPWLRDAAERPIRGVEVAVELAFDPANPDDPFDPDSWGAHGTLEADWETIRGTAAFRAGREAPDGHVLEFWADLPGAPLGEKLSELAAGEPGIREVDLMLKPDGTADVALGVRLPRGRRDNVRVGRALERLVLIRPRGTANLAYHGGVDLRTGRRDVGFPLPVRRVAGDVTWSIRPGGRYPGQLGLYDLKGYHSDGPVDVQGTLHFTPTGLFADKSLVELVPSPFHLLVSSIGLPVDAEFERALMGLAGVPQVDEILPTWGPAGGRLDFDLELWRTVERTDLSMDLDLRLDGVGFRWNAFEVPLENTGGRIRIQTNGGGFELGRGAVTLDVTASTPIARQPLSVRGRVASEGSRRSASWYDIDLPEVNTRSLDLRAELARKVPDALDALDASGVTGFVDLDVQAVQSIPWPEAEALRAIDPVRHAFAGGLEAWTEVAPSDPDRGLKLQPTQFPIVTRSTRGRLIAATTFPPLEPRGERGTPGAEDERRVEPGIATTRLTAAVQGNWQQTGPAVPVIARIEAETGSPARLFAAGAGLNIADRSLVGALTNAARTSSTEGGTDPIDTDALQIAGRVDFGARFTLPEAPGMPATDTRIDVDARLDKLGIDGSELLSDVTAHLVFDDATGMWLGQAIDASLGNTPVHMTNIVWVPTPEGSTLDADIRAEALPIDREHLRFFLDPATLRVVIDDLRARGTLIIKDGHLRLTQRRDGSQAVRLSGEMGLEDAYIDLGIPIEVDHIEGLGIDLQHEGRGLRARASIAGLYGAVAGRRLEDARLQLTYVEPRLVLEAIEGNLAGGRLTAIGGDVAAGADLFTIDLVTPFPFRLAANLQSVDVGRFLSGMFDSDFANRGTMDLSMRLDGDFDHLTEIEGGGEIRVMESALWAIPVFQALSASLGIDTAVVFREMTCGYTIDSGALRLDSMRVNSDLLSLVGSGSIDFAGDVTSDLEVRYGLIDRLGPLTRLLYYIQNSLLRVSIRGTMERPTVVFRGLISQFFAPGKERDRLPLPGFSERPRRF